MLTKKYLTTLLTTYEYKTYQDEGNPVFWKKVHHQNAFDKMAFTLIIVTIDTYTLTIEGMNEMLIRRAVEAGVISIDSIEMFDALRDIVYDNTLDSSPKDFEPIFIFFEQQLAALSQFERFSDEHQKALEHIRLLVISANQTVM